MKTKSQHIPFAKLADLAENRAPADAAIAGREHLAVCSDCAAEFERLGHVLELMKTDTAGDAPRDVLALAINIFSGREQSAAPTVLRRIVAALTFDSSLNSAPAFGVRSGRSGARQLIYSAEQNDIDLRISAEDERWIVAGQLLGQDCVGGRVEIESESELVAAELSELCEFVLPPVPSGSYALRLHLPDAEVEIPRLELRA